MSWDDPGGVDHVFQTGKKWIRWKPLKVTRNSPTAETPSARQTFNHTFKRNVRSIQCEVTSILQYSLSFHIFCENLEVKKALSHQSHHGILYGVEGSFWSTILTHLLILFLNIYFWTKLRSTPPFYRRDTSSTQLTSLSVNSSKVDLS